MIHSRTPTARTHRLEALIALLSANGISGGVRAPWTTPALFVDPANSSGNASDLNSGLDAAHPIRTTARFNQMIANKFVNFANGLAFVGSPVTLRTGSFTAVQAMVPTTNTRERVTDAAVASWTGDVGNFVVDTSLAHLNTTAAVMHDVGGGGHQADLGRPVTPGGAAGVFTALDAYAIKRGGNLTLGAITPVFAPSGALAGASTITYMSDDNSGTPLDLSLTQTPGLSFQDFTFLSAGPLASSIVDQVGTTLTRCIFIDDIATFVSLNSNAIIQLNNCILRQGASTQIGAFFLNSGGTFGQTTGLFVGVTGDVYYTVNISIDTATTLSLFVQPGIGAGIQIQDILPNAGALQVFIDAPDLFGLIWGNGNTGPGVLIYPGATAIVSHVHVPVVTGSSDFAFAAVNGGVFTTTGRSWNEGGDTYNAAAATTWANFVGGAFGFQCHDVATGASIVGV